MQQTTRRNRAKILRGALAFGTLWMMTAGTVRADTITLTASKDNTLVKNSGGLLSNGAGQYFFVGTTNRDVNLRGVLAFNLQTIPTGATITGVTLTLNMSKTIAGDQTLSLFRLTKNWGEGTSSSPAGNGTSATTGDATWIHTFFSTQQWTNPGGDFASPASASLSVGAEASYTWGSTAGMVADVQGWLDTPASNFGWIVIGNETEFGTSKRFDSRENGTAANQPKLLVTYTPPATADISGTLTLQGIVPAAPTQTITFLLHPSDNSGDVTKTANVASNGVFQLSGVPRKNYSLRIKGDRYLAVKINAVNASGGNVSGVIALLKAGDTNADNAADITDLLLLIGHYNQVSPSAGYLSAADLNLDGINDITDLLLLIGNYNKQGDV